METAARQQWMSVLAQASVDDLEGAWRRLGAPPSYRLLRRPEVGLVMVRGRAGGSGQRFNLGEMTVTRCTVELEGRLGHAYVGGRDRRHAELAAVFDALLLDDGRRPTLERRLIAPLAAAQGERQRLAAARSAGTRVEFFTMVRGDE
jgi:alpha-D-ribose 1-methylphosphonate 5-triphosphate synthase subunit PhnG